MLNNSEVIFVKDEASFRRQHFSVGPLNPTLRQSPGEDMQHHRTIFGHLAEKRDDRVQRVGQETKRDQN